MRTVTNAKLVKRNRNLATYLFLATMALLVGGFIFVNVNVFTQNTPNTLILLLQALILPVAFILTVVSVRMTNMWARQPYPENAIEEGLKGISKRSVIYHYYHSPARHVLIAPQGVFAIVTRWHDGHFTVEGSEWTTHKSAISRFLSTMRMDGVGNPTQDAKRAAQYLQKVLEPIAPDVHVKPLIVFINPNAEVEMKDPEVPVLYADEKKSPNLTEYLRQLGREQKSDMHEKTPLPLSKEQIQQFEEKTI